MKPAIVGISGLELTPDEARLLSAETPLGVILFGRNIADPAQLARLIAALRETLPPSARLMVDQEGGRVARLRPPHWVAFPPARALGLLYAEDARAALAAARQRGRAIGDMAKNAGFDLVAAPVLDVPTPGAHDVIGDRAFSENPEAVARLGAELAAGLMEAGVTPIGKHIPGHGRAGVDSHLTLPTLEAPTEADLLPFQHNAHLPWMMTAHIRYTAWDMHRPATLSPTVIERVIRATGFDGVLVSDDLAMGALSGTPGERAAAAIAAGCDVALHCSGNLAETADVLASLSHGGPREHLWTARPAGAGLA